MEPRMMTRNVIEAVKAMAEEFPEYKSWIPSDDAALPDADDKKNLHNGENIMEQNEIKSAVDSAVAEALKKVELEQTAKAEKEAALKAAEDAGYKKALEDVKGRKAPAFNTITERGFSEEKDAVPAFKHWLYTGDKNGGLIEPDSVMGSIKDAKAAWNVTTGGTGGFLVPDPLYSQIIAKRNIASWIRQAPVQNFQTASDHLLVPRESTSHTAFVLTAEAAAYDENEGTVTQKDLILYKYTKLTKVSEEFLMYNNTNWESWFTQAMARAEAVTENTFSISGNGSGQPEGLSSGATASALTIKTSAQLNPEDLTAMIGKLGAGYNVPSECGFVGANASKWYLKNAILAGPFAYASNNGSQGAPDFFGYPFFVDDDVTSYTTTSSANIVLYFGNMNYYGVVEKPGMVIQRNPYLYMANGQVGIFASIFRGAGVLQSEAIYSVNGK
jgi:HK97 family phage major capsid protein